MNTDLIQYLQYSYAKLPDKDAMSRPIDDSIDEKVPDFHYFPQLLDDSFQLISEFFKVNNTNKLCLVFSSKEYAAQWLALPTVLTLIALDFSNYKNEIADSYKDFRKGDKLLLNGKAIVEWVGVKDTGVAFITKGVGESSGAEIKIGFTDAIKLQKITDLRQLSSLKKVKEILPKRNITPTERLLKIDTYGNKEFIKSSICLISKYKSYDDSIDNILLNNEVLSKYFIPGKIDENGKASQKSPFLITTNFSNLILYLTVSTPVSKIIIDSFSSVIPKSDFSEIDVTFKIPTILITDLSEIESFEEIKNHGFEFFNFTKESITFHNIKKTSPFDTFERKLKNYTSFKLNNVTCENQYLESISQKLHSLIDDDSDENLNILKISLIQLTNLLSRVCYETTASEISEFREKILKIQSHFNKCEFWLGESKIPIGEILALLNEFVSRLLSGKTEKCTKLAELLKLQYDYIICPTEDEANILKIHIHSDSIKIISAADVNNSILSERDLSAILTGWPKSNNLNRLLSSFVFSSLTVLFYDFENRYFASLLKRNCLNIQNIKSTITRNGISSATHAIKSKGFEELFSQVKFHEKEQKGSFDIAQFELKLDNTQYSKYSSKGNIAESCKAKRIDFENNTFLFVAESHKFIEINELIEGVKSNPNINYKRFEALQIGDLIAFINTDRDILVELVKKTTKPNEFASVIKWTELWRTLLRAYFDSIGNDFKKLVVELRKFHCMKHPLTIKAWLQDDNRIGPEDDNDLISIALITQSPLLNDNIANVRKAIRQMTGWRMKVSDLVREKIKSKLLTIANHSLLNSTIEIPDLGRVDILKVHELKNEPMEIDKKFVHHLFIKEII